MHHLEHVHVASDRDLVDTRFPVQYVVRPKSDEHHDYRGYAGMVAGGVLKPGDEVVVLPSGMTSTIEGIDLFDQEIDRGVPADVGDGAARRRRRRLARRHDRPGQERPDAEPGHRRDGLLDDQRAAEAAGQKLAIKHTTRTARALVKDIQYRLDVNTLHRDQDTKELGLNEIGRVQLRTTVPLLCDPYSKNRTTGSFILIDEATGVTVGAGMINSAAELLTRADAASPSRSPQPRWRFDGDSGDTGRSLDTQRARRRGCRSSPRYAAASLRAGPTQRVSARRSPQVVSTHSAYMTAPAAESPGHVVAAREPASHGDRPRPLTAAGNRRSCHSCSARPSSTTRSVSLWRPTAQPLARGHGPLGVGSMLMPAGRTRSTSAAHVRSDGLAGLESTRGRTCEAVGVDDDLLGGRQAVDRRAATSSGTLRLTSASAIGPSSWWRARGADEADGRRPSTRRASRADAPAAGSPSRRGAAASSRRGGRPRVCTRATVSWPR